MASRFVPCRDLEHVLEMHDAGLLYTRWNVGWFPTTHQTWRWERDGIERFYNKAAWPEEDWAVLVEEDED